MKDKPREWSQVIALRSALRVVPAISKPSWNNKRRNQKNLTLTVFRALVIASGAIGSRSNKFVTFNTDSYAVENVASYTTNAAAYAANAAVRGATYAIYSATNSVANASFAAAYVASAYKNDIWRAINNDIYALQNGEKPKTGFPVPIWHNQPKHFVDLNTKLKADLSVLGDDFSIWSEWYQRRVDGKANAFAGFDRDADEKFYRFLVEQDDDWWKREPALVNADIKALVDSLRKRKAPTDQELVQNPEVVNYVLNDADQAEPAPEPLPNGLTNDRDNRDNHEEIWRLLDKALAASGIGATQATYLTDDLQNFGEALGEEIEGLSPRKFVLRADELQRLIDQDQAEGQDNLKPPFSQAQIDALLPMLSAVKMYIEFEPRLAHLRNGPNSVTEPILNKEQAQAIVQATQEVGLVPENDNITQSAVDNISSGAGENDPARRKASEMLVNMLRAFGRRIKSLGEIGNTTERIIRIGQRIGELWDKVRAIVPEDSLIAQIIRWIIMQGN